MRFETRYDRWLVALLAVAGIGTVIVLPAVGYFSSDRPVPPWVPLLTGAIWIVALGASLPQYYEVRADALFIRQGWRRIAIPYDSLVEIASFSNAMSAPVFSTQRLMVITRDGRRIVIAVRDEARFLDEVARRAPHLERREFGLAVPLARSIV